MNEIDDLRARLSAAEFAAKHNYDALQQEMTRKMPDGLIEAADALHSLALARADKIFTLEADAEELDKLATAIERYEKIRWPVG